MILIEYQQVIQGSFFTANDDQEVEFQKDVLICVDEQGQIANIINPNSDKYEVIQKTARIQDRLVQTADDEYIIPGFIDLHVHAPQWTQAGLALDRPLDEWLNTYTFPLEAKYADVEFAKQNYQDLVKKLLAHGTTTVLYFGTIHEDSNLALAEACQSAGQRAFIGQVVMDNVEQTPDYYRNQSTQEALDQTISFIEHLQAQFGSSQLIQPVVTPRFTPSCTDEALQGLGEIAEQYQLLIQSHVNESNWVHDYALERFNKNDTEIFKDFGLLTDRSIFAHGTQLNDSELDLFEEYDAAIAHCPISNAFFGNAVLPVQKILRRKIKVGIGTDISGGYSPSMYRNIQQSVISSRMLEDGVDNEILVQQRGKVNSRITTKQAFYMATVNGANALHIKAGRIKAGYSADLQIVKDDFLKVASQDPEDVFERLIYQTDASDISKVFVQGQLVNQK